MKKRWSANTWVVVILFTVIGLISIDIGRHLMLGDKAEPDEPTRSSSTTPSFKVGDKAPDFTLPNKKGQRLSLSQLVKGDTMLWFTCGCSNCREMQTYAAGLVKRLGNQAPKIINVTTMVPDREETWYRDTQLKQTVLYENAESNNLGEIYHGHPCPRVFRIKPDRTVAMIGTSPAAQPDMNLIAGEIAHDLGFQFKGENRGADKPVAPTPAFPPPGIPQTPTHADAAHADDHAGHGH